MDLRIDDRRIHDVPGVPSPEPTSGAVFVIHLFRMVLFMMLAGFFARMVLQRRGPPGPARWPS